MMSDEIDPVAIGAWWAAVVFQVGTAVRDIWQEWLERQRWRYPPNFQRIVNGETRNGWRQIIPCPEEIASHLPSKIFNFNLVMPAVTRHADEPRPFRSTVLLDVIKPLIDGRFVRTLRKCSILRSVSVDLLHVRFNKQEWSPAFSCYLNFHTVAMGFRRRNTTTISVQLVDLCQGRVRQIMVTAPEEGLTPYFAYATTQPQPRFHIVFKNYEDENWTRLQLSDAEYEIWPDDGSTGFFFRPISWESIIIPVGGRTKMVSFLSGSGLVFFAYETWNENVAENGLCISFDHTRTWHVDTLDQWESRMRETSLGASICEAVEAFSTLPPPNRRAWRSLFHIGSIPFPDEGEILFYSEKAGVMQRWLTPFLKRIAVEDFCKKNPHVTLAAIKEATGVDVSDGVSEEGDNRAKVIDL